MKLRKKTVILNIIYKKLIFYYKKDTKVLKKKIYLF